jgi:hypothetical protein
MADICNYKIILIDSDNVIYNEASNIYNFHIKLSDNIRDVYKLKILFDAISIPSSNLTTPSSIAKNLDNIYINLNDYDRVKSNAIDEYGNSVTRNNYFDSIMIDFNKIKSIDGVNDITMYNDFNENEGDFYLKPIESNFNLINIKLLNINNEYITKTYVSRFVMKLCIYYNTKKISQF